MLEATQPWETQAVMTRSIIDLPNGALRMYYAGREAYELDAIGVAHSYNEGLTCVKRGDLIFRPDRTSSEIGAWFDSHKVTSSHVIEHDGYYYSYSSRNCDRILDQEEQIQNEVYPMLLSCVTHGAC